MSKNPLPEDNGHFWENIFSSPSAEVFISVFNAIHEGIEIVDSAGWVKYVNPAFLKITGLKEKDRLDYDIKELVPSGPLARVIKTGQAVYGEKLEMKDAGIDIICNAAPIFVKGQLTGAIVVFQDVTELSRLNLQLQESRKRIRALNCKLSTFTTAAYSFGDILGSSHSLMNSIKLARRAARTEATVLLTGESGTGKELFAHAIHRESLRQDNSFIKVNCAAIPDNLLESEFFGYEKGAFTGANRRKMGMFDLANEGTIFLDEIGDMSLPLQAKILRVLEDGQVFRVGGTEPVSVDVRVIVATNRKLEKLCEEGKFRNDLFYRINVINVEIPPLRERREDILTLTTYFLQKIGRKVGRDVRSFTEEAGETLLAYCWPGNVRELRNCIERAVIMGERDLLTAKELQFLQPRNDVEQTTLEPSYSLKNMERDMIADALAVHGWTVVGKQNVANDLNISLRTLYNKIKRYGLTKT